MSGFQHLGIVVGGIGVGIVVAVGVTAFVTVDQSPLSIDIEPIAQPKESPVNIREIERSRRAQQPATERKDQLFGRPQLPSYTVLAGRNPDELPRPKPAEAMSPTSCRSVEPILDSSSGPHRVHQDTISDFEYDLRFGSARMPLLRDRFGVSVSSKVIDCVELVSLLTESEASVYVFDEKTKLAIAQVAKRRPLDEFERRGLDAVRRGENLVWTPEAPKRMFGAIRAKTQCLECHVNAKEGDLLGAFTYYLEVPVDQLAKREKE